MTQSQILNANFDWLQVGKVEHFPEYKIDTQKTMFSRIVEAKRSTFDRSKFEVVGSPTITDDGIASGFSSTDYIRQVSAAVQPTNEVVFKASYKLLVVNVEQIILLRHTVSFNDNNNRYFFSIMPNGTFRFAEQISGSYTEYTNLFGGKTAKANDILDLTIKVKANAFYITATINNEILGTEVIENRWNTIPPLVENDSVIQWHASGYFRGIVYLTNYFIDVDGLRFFECVKTGVDQIKKDDYTIVGNPVISEDGIASGFTTSSAIQPIAPYNISSFLNVTKSWDITIRIQYLSTDTNIRGLFLHYQFPLLGAIGILGSTIGLGGKPEGGNQQWIVNTSLNSLGISDGDFVNIRVTFDVATLTYSLYASKNNEPLSFIKSVVSTGNLTVASSTQQVKFACYDGNGYRYNFDGLVDLNAFKIYVDGNLVYQPTLRIPYTQSKTGSKIVDAVYRDRVKDMYEQFGYTHYYTIGDEPEKYNVQVVGSPTLVGGVASGFSSSNYLTSPIAPDFSKPFEIKSRVIRTANNLDYIYSWNNNNNFIYFDTSYNVYAQFGAWNYNTGQLLKLSSIPVGDTLIVHGWNGTNHYLKVEINGVEYSIEHELTTKSYTNTSFKIGYTASSKLLNGSIDLSQFSITVDGKEVVRGYEPAIVDAYTLQTVPNEKIVDSYYADNSFMELTADLSLTQGGGAMSSQTVNLKRPYKDNKYIVTIGTSSKSTESFVASATGQWITKGKGVLG